MRIFTSSWFTRLPDDIVRVGISRGTPRGQKAGFRMMRKLAPGAWFNSVEVGEYRRRFFADLAKLDASSVVDELQEMGGGADVALLCFEAPHKSADWCHRGYVSVWLKDQLDLDVHEFGLEQFGCGWEHPKIPELFRARPDPEPPFDVSPFIGQTATDRTGMVWTVIGANPDLPGQAIIQATDSQGEVLRASISADVLKTRFA